MKTLTVRDDTTGFNPTGGFLVCTYRNKRLAVFHYGHVHFGTFAEAKEKVRGFMAEHGFTHHRWVTN